jgi:hypothetical protein
LTAHILPASSFSTRGQVFVGGQQSVRDLDKGADDQDVYLDGSIAVQNGGERGHFVLGEGIRQVTLTATTHV